MPAVILIVDDDEAHRGMLTTVLRGWGYATEEADDGDTAVEKVQKKPYDAILCDIRMRRVDGITAIRNIFSINPAIPVLVMTAWQSVETAVAALRLGAYDYLEKPLDFDLLHLTLERALDHTRLALENRELRERLWLNQPENFIGRSEKMRDLLALIQTVAPSEATVLITGESGTGKECVAKAIQRAGLRRDKPFVTVNCAALSESLLESELFGHEKGAFTGADRHREGRFKQADGGTIFLDEIGEVPLQIQPKLLRALQSGEIQRVGSDVPLMTDVRVIAATNRDLLKEVEAGHFREDLYYRLNVIGIEVPPLRERREDIPVLSKYFIEKFAKANQKNIKGISPQCMDLLTHYDWPGNVRELENAMERAVILCLGDFITQRELPLSLTSSSKSVSTSTASISEEAMTLEEIERNAILRTLQKTGDNKSETARLLGITRATLHNKLRRYDVEKN
ncbi:MAG: sigma-54 dependent transcriptional regulator [Desulfovibrionaceae bacterium]|nr:sigma-54 dependent transcriptional regulator [Desulfovibrionaceae bacterium]